MDVRIEEKIQPIDIFGTTEPREIALFGPETWSRKSLYIDGKKVPETFANIFFLGLDVAVNNNIEEILNDPGFKAWQAKQEVKHGY